MPFTKKPAFEQFRATLISSGKPIPEKEMVPIQAEIVAHLDTIKDLLVQKVRRQGHKETLIEISSSWVGLDGDTRNAIATLKKSWPAELFGNMQEMSYIEPDDETVIPQFACRYPEKTYLTGRILITF